MPYTCLYLEPGPNFASFHYTHTGHTDTASRQKSRLTCFGFLIGGWHSSDLASRKLSVANVKHILETKYKNGQICNKHALVRALKCGQLPGQLLFFVTWFHSTFITPNRNTCAADNCCTFVEHLTNAGPNLLTERQKNQWINWKICILATQMPYLSSGDYQHMIILSSLWQNSPCQLGLFSNPKLCDLIVMCVIKTKKVRYWLLAFLMHF